MPTYFSNGVQKSGPRWRNPADFDIVDGFTIMSRQTDLNGQNMKFLEGVISDLIRVVNAQQRELEVIKEKLTPEG